MVVRMISVGEQTGSLEKMLSKISDFYDDQVNAAVSGLTSMIEPLIIAFLGIVIGGIVIALTILLISYNIALNIGPYSRHYELNIWSNLFFTSVAIWITTKGDSKCTISLEHSKLSSQTAVASQKTFWKGAFQRFGTLVV